MTLPSEQLDPVVLIVDDDEEVLRSRTQAFLGSCSVIGVQSIGDAMRELREAPMIDAVMTDIHLGASDNDQSGVELARYVRDKYPKLPVTGYSAVFAAHDLPEEASLFEAFWEKGSMDYLEIDEMVQSCQRLALRHRSSLQYERRMQMRMEELDDDLATLEARVDQLDEVVQQVERTSVTTDKAAWTVLGIIGAVVALLAAMVGLALALEKIIG